jgi:hypothetical protein
MQILIGFGFCFACLRAGIHFAMFFESFSFCKPRLIEKQLETIVVVVVEDDFQNDNHANTNDDDDDDDDEDTEIILFSDNDENRISCCTIILIPFFIISLMFFLLISIQPTSNIILPCFIAPFGKKSDFVN